VHSPPEISATGGFTGSPCLAIWRASAAYTFATSDASPVTLSRVHGLNPVQMEKFLRRAQRMPCRGDDAVFDARKYFVSGFGRFRNFAARAPLQVFHDRGSGIDIVAAKDLERVSVRRRVRCTRTGGDMVGSSPVTSEMISASTGALHTAASRPP